MTAKSVCALFASSFDTRKRDNGEEYVCLKDGSPQWMTDAVREAHGDMMPDDTRYRMIQEVLSSLDGRDELDEGEDDVRDIDHEICDGLVDVYNSALHQWLASHLERAGYCDEAQRDGLVEESATIEERLRAGQYGEYHEIFSSLVGSIFAQAEAEETMEGTVKCEICQCEFDDGGEHVVVHDGEAEEGEPAGNIVIVENSFSENETVYCAACAAEACAVMGALAREARKHQSDAPATVSQRLVNESDVAFDAFVTACVFVAHAQED